MGVIVQRTSKIAAVAAIAFLFSLVLVGNLTDYTTNFEFVRHVLSMDTLPADTTIRYRAITNPLLHHAGYWLIIGVEAMVVLLGWIGVRRMIRALRGERRAFAAAKTPALAGLTLAYLLAQVGIFAVGNEWFGMWMSKDWNGVESVFRLVVMTLGALIFVSAD